MAQICYYFEAVAQVEPSRREQLVIAVPSGNFGNLTAGLLAKAMGLPVKRFIAATNVNDTVPRYLETGEWTPAPTIPTLSNAMDVSQPNNWPRIEELCRRKGWGLSELGSGRVSDEETAESLKSLFNAGYVCEPHGAIAYRLLDEQMAENEHGIFLCTAHPAKFKESVDEILNQDIPLPAALAKHAAMDSLSVEKPADFQKLRQYLLDTLQ